MYERLGCRGPWFVFVLWSWLVGAVASLGPPQVPKANLVGKTGDAVLHMMRNLELERLALAGMSLGIARRCVEVCV